MNSATDVDGAAAHSEAGPVAGLVRAIRAELLRVRAWPAIWVTGGIWLLLGLTFGYLFPYLSYRTGDMDFAGDGQVRAQLLADVLPANIPAVMVQGMPMFGGSLALVIGAIIAANGYGWGTWKTIFAHRRGRLGAVAGSMIATAVVVVTIVVATVVLCVLASVTIALVEGASMAAPGVGALVESFGGGTMLLLMWALIGFALGTLVRGSALSIGLGLVWVMVVENLLRGVGTLLAVVATVVEYLPGTAGGSSIGALLGDAGGAPGVLTDVPGTQAGITVAAYLVVSVVVTLVVVRRRDIV